MTEAGSIGEGSQTTERAAKQEGRNDYFGRRKSLMGQLSVLYEWGSPWVPLDMPTSEDEWRDVMEDASLRSNKAIKRLIRQRKAAIQEHRRQAGSDERWPILF